MKQVGVIGLGDMGSGLAKNLIANGFEVRGYDLDQNRMQAFEAMGGIGVTSVAELGASSELAYVMVMNGQQAAQVMLGDDQVTGLTGSMAPGGIIILTATIRPTEAQAIGKAIEATELDMIDSPVSGGFPGAQGGTLTMMASAPESLMTKAKPAMEAVSGTIHHVGTEMGMGQTVKACLQSLIGAIFSATFESSVLAAKAGVDAQALYKVFSTSGAGCGITKTALENIISGQFEGTGSHINTMHKDLTIATDFARDLGVPMFTAAMAMQLFQAGKTKYPYGDNQVVTHISEDIVGAKLRKA